MPQRFPLTAYDRLFLASHQALHASGRTGHVIFATLDLVGPLDLDRLRRALSLAMQRHALTCARIGQGLVTARAHWRLDDDWRRHAENASIESHDLAGSGTPEIAVLDAHRDDFRDPTRGPQVRLLHFRRGPDAHRLVLAYPHYLMDLGGGERFFMEMDRLDRAAASGGAHEPFDPAEIAPSYPSAWSGRIFRRLASGLRDVRRIAAHDGTAIRCAAAESSNSASLRIHRMSPEQTAATAAACADQATPGPYLHTRWHLRAALLAIEDLRGEVGYSSDVYIIPLPVQRPSDGPPLLTRNNLTIAQLVIERRLLGRQRELDESLTRQIADYTATGRDEASWLALSYAGLLRMRHYRWMLRRGLGVPPTSIGFTYYRAAADFTTFLDCRTAGLAAVGLPTIPPGQMLSFVKSGDRLNLGMAGYASVLPATLGDRLFAQIQSHLGMTPGT